MQISGGPLFVSFSCHRPINMRTYNELRKTRVSSRVAWLRITEIYCSVESYSLENKIKYRVTRRVFSEPVKSKLHLLNTKNLAGHLKTPKVIRISAMHANFSHSPVHGAPICFHRTKNLKLPSGTNKSNFFLFS